MRFAIQLSDLQSTSKNSGFVFLFEEQSVFSGLGGCLAQHLFTNDERVADTISDLSLLLSFSVLLNSVYPVLSGVAIGAGMQTTVAVINLICFYLIGVPLGAFLGYLTSLEVKGIWIGMIGGVLAQIITLIYMIWRTNWDDEVKSQQTKWIL
ncbi:putative multi antimicrobial extrusion protein [Helianthus annuus]|nr:putative multi antimicrobial extrusion protein [Helianthus annuus]